jgi:hypothetical protein
MSCRATLVHQSGTPSCPNLWQKGYSAPAQERRLVRPGESPEALRKAGLIDKHEFKESLRTSDYAEARRLLLSELIAIDAQIAAAKRKLDPAPVRALTRSEAEHIALAWFYEREDVRIERKRSAAPAWSRHDELMDREIEEATFADPEDTNGQASTLSTA